eukprot:GFUD01071214.1.p1 GENE.GFUD01071214.1~~GFUD01071214.1.p1  ORF type:complete len:143 (-),score=4.68 GFUD01071214.1:317-745(-)
MGKCWYLVASLLILIARNTVVGPAVCDCPYKKWYFNGHPQYGCSNPDGDEGGPWCPTKRALNKWNHYVSVGSSAGYTFCNCGCPAKVILDNANIGDCSDNWRNRVVHCIEDGNMKLINNMYLLGIRHHVSQEYFVSKWEFFF